MQTAMIWGANGGIGQALVKQLTTQDWHVIAIARHYQGIESESITTIDADATDPQAVETAITIASQTAVDVPLWIYAAGDITSAKVADLRAADWHRILGANLTGAYLTTHYSLPLLDETCHLMYIGAISERLQLPGLSAYVAAKAGLEAWATSLAKEERRRRITVVRPGAVVTPFWDKVPLKLPKDALSADSVAQQIIDAHQQGHKGTLDITS